MDEVNSMRRSKMNHVVGAVVALCGLALSACGGGGAEGPSGGEATTGGENAEYAGPITSTDAAHGKEVFDTSCGDCHPGGESDVGPSLIENPHTPPRIRQQIREGSGKMKPFSEKRLSNEDMESVLAYLASINAVK
jgi:mono/diheme cytochrome c family protein